MEAAHTADPRSLEGQHAVEHVLYCLVTMVGQCCHVPIWTDNGRCLPSAGVGRALAEDFLEAGDNVVICARSGGCSS